MTDEARSAEEGISKSSILRWMVLDIKHPFWYHETPSSDKRSQCSKLPYSEKGNGILMTWYMWKSNGDGEYADGQEMMETVERCYETELTV